MGQTLSACCSRCLARGGAKPNLLIKPSSGPIANDVQQPLVVEDESWKKWSSYNLIHNGGNADGQEDQYLPPTYVSQQMPAEAVWDL